MTYTRGYLPVGTLSRDPNHFAVHVGVPANECFGLPKRGGFAEKAFSHVSCPFRNGGERQDVRNKHRVGLSCRISACSGDVEFWASIGRPRGSKNLVRPVPRWVVYLQLKFDQV